MKLATQNEGNWYLQTWFISLCFAFWFFIIPLFLGITLLVMRYENNYKMNVENSGISKEETTQKSIFKDGKNIAILLLSILSSLFLLAFIGSSVGTETAQVSAPSVEVSEYEKSIDELKRNIEDNQNQITELQNENKELKENNTRLEEEKQNIENEKNTLASKVEELEKQPTNTSNTSTASKPTTTQSNPSPSSTSTSSSSKPASNSSSSISSSTPKATQTQPTAPSNNNNSQMVWIGDTGNKYHNQNCRTLKGNGHQITMQQALAEGRQACKVCH